MREQVIDVGGLTRDEVDLIAKSMGGFLHREYYHFGTHATYQFADGFVGIVYYGALYVAKGLHVEVLRDLERNWCPVSLEAQAWKRNNMRVVK